MEICYECLRNVLEEHREGNDQMFGGKGEKKIIEVAFEWSCNETI